MALEMKRNKDTHELTCLFRTFILVWSKILMYEFCYDYVKLKYGEKAKLCYMDTHSFTVYRKTDDIYRDIAEMLKLDLILQIMN